MDTNTYKPPTKRITKLMIRPLTRYLKGVVKIYSSQRCWMRRELLVDAILKSLYVRFNLYCIFGCPYYIPGFLSAFCGFSFHSSISESYNVICNRAITAFANYQNLLPAYIFRHGKLPVMNGIIFLNLQHARCWKAKRDNPAFCSDRYAIGTIRTND